MTSTFQPTYPPSRIDPFMVPEQEPPHILYAYAGDVVTNDPATGGVSMYFGGVRFKINQGPRLQCGCFTWDTIYRCKSPDDH